MSPLFFLAPASRRAVLGGGLALAAATSAAADGTRWFDEARARPGTRAPSPQSKVVELRQYALRKGERDALVSLFDREFLESQEALGARVIAEFRDLDRPEMFVWLRGFPDMETRRRALDAFYAGPVWQANREAANATMIDSGNVLLLRPARAGAGFHNDDRPRPPKGAARVPDTVVAATIWNFEEPVSAEMLARFEKEAAPLLARAGAGVAAFYATEEAPNNYPRLPIREGEHVFVWFSVFADETAERRAAEKLAASKAWEALVDSVAYGFRLAPEHLRLQPTPRSRPLI